MAQDAPFFAPGAYDADAEQIRRRMQYAQALQQQGQDFAQGQMVSGRYVAPSWTQHLSTLLKGYMGAQAQNKASQDLQDLSAKRSQQQATDMAGVLSTLRGTPGTPEQQGPQAQGGSPELNAQPGVAGDPNAALAQAMASRSPGVQALGQSLAQSQLKRLEPENNIVVGRSLVGERSGVVKGVDQTWQGEQDAGRAERKAQAEATLADRAAGRQQQIDAQAELQRQRAEDQRGLRQMVGSMRPEPAPTLTTIQDANDPTKSVVVDARTNRVIGKAPGDKNAKLPTSALKLQQEELDAIGTSSGITSDVSALQKQITDGKLNLGLVSNAYNSARNAVGASSPESQKLSAFKSSIEKLRNDSLRLNKGVQTEGDAVRAMNELMSGINDPEVVKTQLGRIAEINQRAVNIRRANVDQIRSNFGVAPMDETPYTKQPAAVGDSQPKRVKYDAQGNVVP